MVGITCSDDDEEGEQVSNETHGDVQSTHSRTSVDEQLAIFHSCVSQETTAAAAAPAGGGACNARIMASFAAGSVQAIWINVVVCVALVVALVKKRFVSVKRTSFCGTNDVNTLPRSCVRNCSHVSHPPYAIV